MKNFAQIDSNNLVTQIIVIDKKNPEEWLTERFGGQWIEAFLEGGQRKNYPAKGYSYNNELDAFIAPKPYESWTLNEETCKWEAPVEYPADGKHYLWDEETTSWVEYTPEAE